MSDDEGDEPGDQGSPASDSEVPTGGLVEWLPWGQAAFDETADADRPVLLSLTATWSPECREMDVATYGEPRIAAAVDDGFVPVRADVDRHPRVAARYSMGGVPSTVFLTPGGDVLTGAGALSPVGMRGAIEGARRSWEEQGAAAGTVPRSLEDQEPPGGDLDASIEGHMLEVLRENYDERAGGWGTGAKFPLPRTVEFALKRDRGMALRTLDAIAANLLDEHDGGFFRGAAESDWSGVRYEKLLDTNAAVIRAFTTAYRYTGEDAYRASAERGVEYLTTTLWTDVGPGEGAAFAASQAAGDGADYYTRDATEREAVSPPPVDDVLLADWNAVAVDALLAYAALTDDERAIGFARRALATLIETLVVDGQVVHYRVPREASAGDESDDVEAVEERDCVREHGSLGERCREGERGLLLDHARVVRALCRARSVLGPAPDVGADPVALATRLADHALAELRPDRTFVDGPPRGPGLLDRPLRPLDANVEFADALLDLHALTGDDRYGEAAREATAAFAGAHERFGPQAAAFASVAGRLLREPVRIDVAAPVGSDLHRAALRVADHEAVVVPAADEPTAGRDGAGRESSEDEVAYVVVGDEVSAPAGTPDELGERIAALL